jgi:hypothetical protein
MNYYTTGKIHEHGPISEGTSQSGNKWQRMTLVLDVQVGQYSKKMAFQVMTGNIPAVMAFKTGDKVEVSWDISSREYTNAQGVRSWFTQADLRSIKAAEDVPQVAAEPVAEPMAEQGEDLPF